ncbi:MarR family winged helix-turn-helix transcriptional regulator [Asanoa iriomotensis]|uniref:HTH marR-type domain-containing protein n=1 Tax=Asanoa iriomotensis TaxID=234613 RepID=A0ABQ4CG92_9ACTN|nr:hypothetical protein [Asanoa iriomotensis]GIF61798.1 hypothetical protein Air01nite_78930 [Asanoa iriomotensis]
MTDFSAQLLGRTEKALNAILDRLLADIGVTEPQWVALTLTITAGDAPVVAQIAHALKVDEAAARRRLDELADAGLVRVESGGGAVATEEGVARWQRVRAATGPITQQLWGDLPEADLAAAGRVLTTVLARADAVFASTSA